MRKINERTWAEIEAASREIERKGLGEGPGPEWLPCGAQAVVYWQDEQGREWAACGSGQTYRKAQATFFYTWRRMDWPGEERQAEG